MPVDIEKKLGRDRKFFTVPTVDELDEIFSRQGLALQDLAAGATYIRAGETGLGETIGITDENLTGDTYTDFDAKLYAPVEEGIDYLIYDVTTRNIYVFTPTTEVQGGEVNIPIQSSTIKAPAGSPILKQSMQTMQEQREFRARIDSLNTNLGDLNNNVLPELEENLGFLDGYLTDPSSVPAGWSYFETILADDVWAGTGTFFEVWADNVFTNSLMADTITANVIDVYDLATVLLTSQFIKANEIALVGELPAGDDPDDVFKGGLIRSSTFDGTISASNQITGTGTAGWAIDYSGESVFNNATVRGTITVLGGNAATKDYSTSENLKGLKEELVARKDSIDQSYTTLSANSDLDGAEKTALDSAKTTLDTEHNDLVNFIDTATADDEVDGTEYTTFQGHYTDYRTALASYTSAYEDAVDSIAQQKADTALSDAQAYTDTLETYVDGAFEDGVVSQAESKAIERHLNQLASHDAELDKRYSEVYNNADLSGTPKTNLFNAKASYDTEYSDLTTAINNAISDGTITTTERNTVNTAFDDYDTALDTLSERFEQAIDAISQQKADTALSDAQAYTDTLETYVDGAFEDSVVSQAEGKAIERHLKELASRDSDVDSRYTVVYNNPNLAGTTEQSDLASAKSTYDTEYSDLVNAINSAISDGEITSTERTNVNTAFDNYATALDTLAEEFEDAIDKIAQVKADNAESNANTFTQSELDDAAQGLGYTDFADWRSKIGTSDTIIDGNFIRTGLIQADALLADDIAWTGTLANTSGSADIYLGTELNSVKANKPQVLIGGADLGNPDTPFVHVRQDSNNFVELVGRTGTETPPDDRYVRVVSGGTDVFWVDEDGASYGNGGSVFEDVTVNGTLTMDTGVIRNSSDTYRIDDGGFEVRGGSSITNDNSYVISNENTGVSGQVPIGSLGGAVNGTTNEGNVVLNATTSGIGIVLNTGETIELDAAVDIELLADGDVFISTVSGSIKLSGLPTSDPNIAGALYRDANDFIKYSTG